MQTRVLLKGCKVFSVASLPEKKEGVCEKNEAWMMMV